ncbi:hypothetical protein DFJ74DRAFT_710805 [Hyaloraphidium curvatum]|nr:hypothetical protein DFJ74DRAFT_710805 [Hyaloraphidium curvatum]
MLPLAEYILSAHAAGLPVLVAPPAELVPTNAADAYPAALEVSKAREPQLGPRVGWKIAVLPPPVGDGSAHGGAVHTKQVHGSGGQLDRGSFNKLGLEVEVLVRLGETIPLSAARTLTAADSAKYIGTVAAAFEVIDNRYTRLHLPLLVADGVLFHSLVIGPEVPAADILPHIADLPASLAVDGKTVAEGNSSRIAGNPLNNVAALARTLAGFGIELRKGDVLSTGSAIVPWFAPPDVKGGFGARAEVGRLGAVEVSFVEKAPKM